VGVPPQLIQKFPKKDPFPKNTEIFPKKDLPVRVPPQENKKIQKNSKNSKITFSLWGFPRKFPTYSLRKGVSEVTPQKNSYLGGRSLVTL